MFFLPFLDSCHYTSTYVHAVEKEKKKQKHVEELSFKSIVAPNIADSYLLFKILRTIDYLTH